MRFYKIVNGDTDKEIFKAHSEEDYFFYYDSLEDGENIIEVDKKEFNSISEKLYPPTLQEEEKSVKMTQEEVYNRNMMQLKLVTIGFFEKINKMPETKDLDMLFNWLKK